MTLGLLSDIHYYSKPYRLRSALRLLKGSETILIVGDIADRGTAQQFSAVLDILAEEAPNAAIFPVCGNHDIQDDGSAYREFEETVLRRFSSDYSVTRSTTGAYCVRLDEDTDLFGLNPLYYQKVFHFPRQGEQLDFLEAQLEKSTAKHHIVICHPPLIAHNPQRTSDMPPYFPKEQDKRLQNITEKYGNIFFLSGHTHFAPTVEQDKIHNVTYINDGSINPTTVGKNGETQPGNVFQLDFDNAVEPKSQLISVWPR